MPAVSYTASWNGSAEADRTQPDAVWSTVRTFNVVDLVNRLHTEAKLGHQTLIADRLTRVNPLILEELGG